MVQYEGEYKLTSTENFDEYMKAVGVGLVMRKMAASATPIITVKVDGEHWHFRQVTTFKTHEFTLTINSSQDVVTADGRKVTSAVSREGDSLREVQTANNFETKILREFTDQGINMVLKCGSVVCKRFYARQ